MNLLGFLGAVLALLGVGLGAFGAHGLASRISEERLKTFHTGVLYHLIHALALWVVGLSGALAGASGVLAAAGWLFFAGIVLFSGSLYLLATERLPRPLGVITPVGGVCFLSGWALVAIFMAQGL